MLSNATVAPIAEEPTAADRESVAPDRVSEAQPAGREAQPTLAADVAGPRATTP